MTLPDNILTPVGNLRGQLTSGGLIPGVPVIIGEASGAVATFYDGTVNPLNELIIGIEPYQEGTGDPSVLNPRPLYGWTGLEFNICALNIFNKNARSTSRGFVDNYYLKVDGTMTQPSSTLHWMISEYFTLKPNTYYTISGLSTVSSAAPSLCLYTPEKEYIKGIQYVNRESIVFLTTEDTCYCRVSIFENVENTMQLELGSSVSTYAPYVGSIIPITWQTEAGPVYAGSYNVTTGILKARPYYASYNGETLVEPWISSLDKYVPGATPTTGAQVVDLGGTETTYQVIEPPIFSLEGLNNIWVNTGVIISCKYLANVNEFLQWVYDNLYNP